MEQESYDKLLDIKGKLLIPTPSVVRIHEWVLKDILEYSTSMPTGVYAGKRWKRRIHKNGQWTDKWLLGEYIDDNADDGTMLIRWTPIEVILCAKVVPYPER